MDSEKAAEKSHSIIYNNNKQIKDNTKEILSNNSGKIYEGDSALDFFLPAMQIYTIPEIPEALASGIAPGEKHGNPLSLNFPPLERSDGIKIPSPKSRQCSVCGKKTRKGRTYCSRVCYKAGVRRSLQRCPMCLEEFMPKKKDQIYCTKACVGKALMRAQKQCPACGVVFLPKRSDQIYCGQECYHKTHTADYAPPELTWETWEKEIASGKAHWRLVPGERWTIVHFWFWLCDTLANSGYESSRNLNRAEWCKLRRFQERYDQGDGTRGVPIARLRKAGHYLARDFVVYVQKFGWKMPFTPGTLIGFWESIIAMQSGKNVSLTQQYDPTQATSWDAVDLSAEDRNLDQTWADVLAPELPVEKPKGRILKVDWRHLPAEKWSVTTLWAYLFDNLRQKNVKVQQLTNGGRVKLNSLVEQETMNVVRLIAQEFVREYRVVARRMDWDGPMRPSVFCGYWKGIKKSVLDKVPFLLQ